MDAIILATALAGSLATSGAPAKAGATARGDFQRVDACCGQVCLEAHCFDF